MRAQDINERLRAIVESGAESGEPDPLPENRIFVNRNIKLSRIRAVGFDMDFTLAQYHQNALDEATYRLTLQTLVDEGKYPQSILQLSYNPGFAIRGLVIDTQLGNVLKMDKFKYTTLGYHGLRPLTADERRSHYRAEKVNFGSDRFRVVDTLFELVETYLFAALIHHLEPQQTPDYGKLFRDIRSAVDQCHRDGTLKSQIMAQPERFIHDDPLLIPTLHKFKSHGKRLFVITNSEPEYTRFMLDYLFRNAAPFFATWQHCFELVSTSAQKPRFFGEGVTLEILPSAQGVFAKGGDLAWVEEKLQASGDEILYVGDHIYGDILRSKRETAWRTCMVIPELIDQIRVENQVRPLLRRLSHNEAKRKKLQMDFQLRSSQVRLLHQFKESEADELEPHHLRQIDGEIARINRLLEKNDKDLSRVLYGSRQMRADVSAVFNPFWGRLFQTGGQLSAFAEQVRDYACVYTAMVSNFNFYSGHSYLQGYFTPMPHEVEIYAVSEFNFDETHEAKDRLPEPR